MKKINRCIQKNILLLFYKKKKIRLCQSDNLYCHASLHKLRTNQFMYKLKECEASTNVILRQQTENKYFTSNGDIFHTKSLK